MQGTVSIPRVMITGTRSGVGKTTVTVGLIAALIRQGYKVQSFKVGADFAECAYLAYASHSPCRNLDSWILAEEGVKHYFVHGAKDADFAIIKGAGGLFDSHYGKEHSLNRSYRFPGSTADVARLIKAPILLVLDVQQMGETAAAIAMGLKQLDPQLNLAGVILNNITSNYLRRSIEDAIWECAGIPVLGALPKVTGDEAIPSLKELAIAVERNCEFSAIEKLMKGAPSLEQPSLQATAINMPSTKLGEKFRIGVAYDEAFAFYHPENLELLEIAGAQIIPFSPLEDTKLPEDLDGLYIGGGTNEIHFPKLARNQQLLEQIKQLHKQDIPIYAVCEGAALCSRKVKTSNGKKYYMAGILPLDMEVAATTFRRGYREVELLKDCLLGPVSTRLRGHEFHSVKASELVSQAHPVYSIHGDRGEPLGQEGWCYGSLLAVSVHVHFGQDNVIPRNFLDWLAKSREQRDRNRVQTSPAVFS